MPGIGFRVGADTQDQIQHCLKCNRKYCINCLMYLRVGQVPETDPCLTCDSKNRCKTKKCSHKSQFESSVKSNPHLLDRDWVSAEYAGSRIKKGLIIFVASSKGPVPREIVKVNKTSFRTEDDLYYFNEHRKLWWFSEAGAKGDFGGRLKQRAKPTGGRRRAFRLVGVAGILLRHLEREEEP